MCFCLMKTMICKAVSDNTGFLRMYESRYSYREVYAGRDIGTHIAYSDSNIYASKLNFFFFFCIFAPLKIKTNNYLRGK